MRFIKTKEEALAYLKEHHRDVEFTDHVMLVFATSVFLPVWNAYKDRIEEVLVRYGIEWQGQWRWMDDPNHPLHAVWPEEEPNYMTAQECLGKWLIKDDMAFFVCSRRGEFIRTAWSSDENPERFHANGWKIADTPTSPPYSLDKNEWEAER